MTACLVMRCLSSSFAVPRAASLSVMGELCVDDDDAGMGVHQPQTSELVTLGHPCPLSPPWEQGWGVGGEGLPCEAALR